MNTTSRLILATILIGSAQASYAEKLTVYGKAHVSGDYIMFDGSSDTVISSNSSRIGFKGDQELKHGLTAIWKYESEIDITAEALTGLKARNRYLGLKHSAGSLLVGYHDTPFKTFGGKAGLFHDTIGERRGILGAGNGSNKFNIRARNAVMYTSPKLANIELRAMQSTGNDKDGDSDSLPVTSASLIFDNKQFYAGVAWEDQSELADTQGTGMRFGAGATFGGTAINFMYEMLESKTVDAFHRTAYGGSASQKMGDLKLKAQVFMLDSYENSTNTGAMLYALGADYKLSKNFTLYGIYAAVNNETNAKVPLAGSGHGEKYSPAAGDAISGISGGMVYKF